MISLAKKPYKHNSHYFSLTVQISKELGSKRWFWMKILKIYILKVKKYSK